MATARKYTLRLTRNGIERIWIDKDTGLLWNSGGLVLPVASIANADSPYTVTEGDFTILADATDGAVTVALPAVTGQEGRTLNIKKVDASANAVTLDGDGSETIDGSTTAAISTENVSLTVQAAASGWYII